MATFSFVRYDVLLRLEFFEHDDAVDAVSGVEALWHAQSGLQLLQLGEDLVVHQHLDVEYSLLEMETNFRELRPGDYKL